VNVVDMSNKDLERLTVGQMKAICTEHKIKFSADDLKSQFVTKMKGLRIVLREGAKAAGAAGGDGGSDDSDRDGDGDAADFFVGA
jgi:hypothetical protein